MMVGNGAVLIHCRTRYCDYPGRLFQYPEDFTMEQLYALRALLLQSTKAVEELRQTHGQRRVVIGTKTHLILGITAYLSDVLQAVPENGVGYQGNGGENGGTGSAYADQAGRPVYGFFGFVWKKKTAGFQRLSGWELSDGRDTWPGFPSPDSFAKLVCRHVLPGWERLYWEQAYGSAYTEQVRFVRELCHDGKTGVSCAVCLSPCIRDAEANTERMTLKIYPVRMECCMLRQVMQEAVKTDRPVSGCTGLPDINSAGRSAFMNVTCAGQDVEHILVKHRKSRNRRPDRSAVMPEKRKKGRRAGRIR